MKLSNITRITCITCLLAAAAFAQTPAPTLSAEQKLSYRDAQHKLDAIEKQQKDLGLQYADIQQKVTTESQRLAGLRQQAQAELDKVAADLKAGVDDKKWKFNDEPLTFTAVPAPAAPANASTSQPAKPTSPGSPGAAVPPVQQARK
jgi:hypothetical protein